MTFRIIDTKGKDTIVHALSTDTVEDLERKFLEEYRGKKINKAQFKNDAEILDGKIILKDLKSDDEDEEEEVVLTVNESTRGGKLKSAN